MGVAASAHGQCRCNGTCDVRAGFCWLHLAVRGLQVQAAVCCACQAARHIGLSGAVFGRGAENGMKQLTRLVVTAACLVLGSSATAQTAPAPSSKPLSTSFGMVVFPAKGQTPQQQSQDEGECYAWSKGQTGVDPMAPAPAPAAQPAQQAERASAGGGSRVRGAARGAAAGAVIGEVANDDASQGAAVGATLGVMKGGAEKRKQQAEAEAQASAAQQQQAAQQQAATQEQTDLFKKGFAACLESKGYTVK
jgi:hypothetical protein